MGSSRSSGPKDDPQRVNIPGAEFGVRAALKLPGEGTEIGRYPGCIIVLRAGEHPLAIWQYLLYDGLQAMPRNGIHSRLPKRCRKRVSMPDFPRGVFADERAIISSEGRVQLKISGKERGAKIPSRRCQGYEHTGSDCRLDGAASSGSNLALFIEQGAINIQHQQPVGRVSDRVFSHKTIYFRVQKR